MFFDSLRAAENQSELELDPTSSAYNSLQLREAYVAVVGHEWIVRVLLSLADEGITPQDIADHLDVGLAEVESEIAGWHRLLRDELPLLLPSLFRRRAAASVSARDG